MKLHIVIISSDLEVADICCSALCEKVIYKAGHVINHLNIYVSRGNSFASALQI